MGRQVGLVDIVANHAVGAECPRDSGGTPQSTFHPPVWESFPVSGEELRDEFVFQDRVKSCVGLVTSCRARRGGRPTMASILPSNPSGHQPSRMEQFTPRCIGGFIPLVPLASWGRMGVFNHTSAESVHDQPACRTRPAPQPCP